MKKSYITDIINAVNASESKAVEVTYKISGGNVVVLFNGIGIDTITESDVDSNFAQKLEADINEAASTMNLPTLHCSSRITSMSFSRIGYCTMTNTSLPYIITIKQTKNKTGVRTERRSTISETTIREYMNKYPTYELYLSFGLFGTPSKVNKEKVESVLMNKDYAAYDLDVIDDELHITALTIGSLM